MKKLFVYLIIICLWLLYFGSMGACAKRFTNEKKSPNFIRVVITTVPIVNTIYGWEYLWDEKNFEL